MSKPPILVNFYIDGFNVYHRIIDHLRHSGGREDYRWLNYRALMKKKLEPGEKIGDLYFFTAIKGATGNDSRDQVRRHNLLVDALVKEGITVIYGKFYQGKEKQTDVNIAAQMVADAHDGLFDRCFLVSADTDFVGAIKAVAKKTKVGIMLPPTINKHTKSDELFKAANLKSRNLKFEDFHGCALPPQKRPPEYANF